MMQKNTRFCFVRVIPRRSPETSINHVSLPSCKRGRSRWSNDEEVDDDCMREDVEVEEDGEDVRKIKKGWESNRIK